MGLRPRFAALSGLVALGVIGAVAFLIWFSGGSDAPLWRLIGIGSVPSTSIPRTVTITIGADDRDVVGPPAAALIAGGRVTFVNRLDTPIDIRSTALAPHRFAITVAAHGWATVTLDRPGLYHYYDASAARPSPSEASADTEYASPAPFTDPSDVIVPKGRHRLARQGWIAVLSAVPGLQEDLTIPRGHAIFTPKVVVAVAGSTINVINHDTWPHNFVVDSASPTGSAFMIGGVGNTPMGQVQRALVLQQPGLYHVYCTLHTRVIGKIGDWHRVAPNLMDGSWSSDQYDPMEAWIIVLPATVTE